MKILYIDAAYGAGSFTFDLRILDLGFRFRVARTGVFFGLIYPRPDWYSETPWETIDKSPPAPRKALPLHWKRKES